MGVHKTHTKRRKNSNKDEKKVEGGRVTKKICQSYSVYDNASREIRRLQIEVSDRFKGRLGFILHRHCKVLSFLRHGVSGVVGVLAWLFRLEGFEGRDLREGENEVGCPGDVFGPPRCHGRCQLPCRVSD